MKPPSLPPTSAPFIVGRYAIFEEIASGGMAAVHLGRLLGAGGFSRTVAIKRLHPQFSKDAEFAAMFMDEAKLAARIHHPNVVQTLDVTTIENELLLVMEYVHGSSFATLMGNARRSGQRVDPRIVAAVLVNMLEGLHAAHEAKNEVGQLLGVVHRDVSPQNLLVGVDGVGRILDFGVAKAVGQMHATRDGQLKGKLAYMSPEQVKGQNITRTSDIFASAIVLWEALMGERLFNGQNPAELIMQVLTQPIPSPRSRFPDLPPALDLVVMKGLAREEPQRYATAREMAEALESAVGLAPPREIGRWVEGLVGDMLGARGQLLESIERRSAGGFPGVQLDSDRVPFVKSDVSSGISSPQIQSGTRERSTTSPKPRTPMEPMFEPTQASPLLSPPSPPGAPRPLPGGLLDDMGQSGASPSNMPPSGLDLDPKPPERRAASGTFRQVGGSTPPPRLEDPLPLGGGMHEARGPVPVRPRPIPVRPAPGPAPLSLREKLETPLKVIAVGVVVSLADVAVRQYTAAWPVRPIWIAEGLVVIGVLWALARVLLPSRD